MAERYSSLRTPPEQCAPADREADLSTAQKPAEVPQHPRASTEDTARRATTGGLRPLGAITRELIEKLGEQR